MLKSVLKPVLGPPWHVLQPVLRATGLSLFRHTVNLARRLRILPQPLSPRQDRSQSLMIINLTPHLGDTVMQMPMIEALRITHPEARIMYVAEDAAAPLLRMMVEIDEVFALPLGQKPPTSIAATAWWMLRLIKIYWRTMRHCVPDICIMPRWGDDQYRSSCLAYLLGAPVRVGFASDVNVPYVPSAPYRDALLTEVIHGGNAIHESDRSLLLLRSTKLIPPDLRRTAAELGQKAIHGIAARTDWNILAKKIGLDAEQRFAVIAPGASHARRIWPIEMWAEVMEHLRREGWQVVLLSGQQDAAIATALHERTGAWARLVAGTTSSAESVTLVSRAKLFLGNDSGPGHIAGAAGVPSIILFVVAEGVRPDHHAAPARIRPMGDSIRICRPATMLPPCTLSCEAKEAHCIRTITPCEVLAAFDTLMQDKEYVREQEAIGTQRGNQR